MGVLMQDWQLLWDDLAKMAQSAFGLADDTRRDFKDKIKLRFEKTLREMDLVTAQQFRAVKAMAEQARLENAALAKRLAVVEKKLGLAAKPAKAAQPKSKTRARKK
jgi:BMFP domain-containing protein YqiC